MMSATMNTENRRILIIDDNRAIHEDFKKILGPDQTSDSGLLALEDALFGETTPVATKESFEIDSAYQGQEGFEKVRSALAEGHPFEASVADARPAAPLGPPGRRRDRADR